MSPQTGKYVFAELVGPVLVALATMLAYSNATPDVMVYDDRLIPVEAWDWTVRDFGGY